MKLFILILVLFFQTSAFAGDCGENCFEKDVNGDEIKETIKLETTKPGTIEIKIVGKTSIPISHSADLQGMYQLTATDRDNDSDVDIMVNWTDTKGMDQTKIFQNNGKGDFKDVTKSEK